VLLDVPKDVQLQRIVRPPSAAPTPARPMRNNSPAAAQGSLQRAADLLSTARRPCSTAAAAWSTPGPKPALPSPHWPALEPPTTLTLMGLGAFPASDPRFLGMLGMHGTLEANLAMHHADLVVCVGARFDDRVTGTLKDFCPQSRKIHIDIDAGQHRQGGEGRCRRWWATARRAAALLALPQQGLAPASRLAPWWERIADWRSRDSLAFPGPPT
jgi:acetolactate synthase-1/2/3 large subunit